MIDISVDNGGIQLAQKVLAVQPHSQIIFMASTDKYYLDVYSVDHVYFLKKPIEPVFLMKALNKAGFPPAGSEKELSGHQQQTGHLQDPFIYDTLL